MDRAATLTLLISAALITGCDPGAESPAPERAAAPPANRKTADEFIAEVNREMEAMRKESSAAAWVYATYITPDTALLEAKSTERNLAFRSRVVEEAKQYEGTPMSAETARALLLLKRSAMPAPNDAAKRAELAEIATRMEGRYGEGKYCPKGPDSCRTLNDLERVLADKRHDYDAQLDAWIGWHTISPEMRGDYRRFVELMNEGARERGYADLSELWRSAYDMPAEAFEQETERLWSQVKPLYDELHCYVRDRLADHYGEERAPRTGPIPAHLLGNMWAQHWDAIYDLVEPFPGVADLDVDSALQARVAERKAALIKVGREEPVAAREAEAAVARDMTAMAEDFYVSLGMHKLPETFWERSLFLKPRDREVVCHASAWSMDGQDDVRIKQCIEPTGSELTTVFHELGHVYYNLHYGHLAPIFRGGAHDGFHEAVGDTVNLSMTPAYLHKLGLVKSGATGHEATINGQMKIALDKVGFLPFGKLIDMWRWAVFDGRIPPDRYNAAWWELRTRYQGIAPPVPRSESDFDPGAKYHIPANTPYIRYFLAHILQFQFHKALCETAGFKGPLHECSVYGGEEAGERFSAMLALGQSRPWQDALMQLTGTQTMDAAPIIEYFQPLMAWLKEQNRDKQCGW